MSHVKRLALLVGMVLVACVLPACGAQGQSPTAQANANEALCASLATFRSSVEDLLALDPSTASLDDVKAARRDIEQAWADVLSTAGETVISAQTDVEDAWSGLAEAVDDVRSDEPISEALASIRAQAEEVQAAYAGIADDVGCQ